MDVFESLGDAEAAIRDERRRAVRLLLRHPFVTVDGPDTEAFALVRRHGEALVTWFREQLGYRLVVDFEFARLYKRRPPEVGGLWHDPPRPALTHTGRPFDRRRYVLLCLVLAALERIDGAQTVLSELALTLQGLTADAEGVEPLDLERHSERQSFVDTIRFLVELGILSLTDGSDTSFVQGTGDALYDIDGRRLAQMVSSPVPPSLADGPGDLAEELYAPTEDGASLRRRHRILRRLVEQPVLYLDQLDDGERTYLSSQRPRLVHQVETWTGLRVEVRRGGLAAIDPDGGTSDVAFPGTSHAAHAALLIADALARRARPSASAEERPDEAVARSELLAVAAELVGEHAWKDDYRKDPTGAALLDDALDLLASLGLVRRRPEGPVPLPALFRYRFTAPDASAEAGP